GQRGAALRSWPGAGLPARHPRRDVAALRARRIAARDARPAGRTPHRVWHERARQRPTGRGFAGGRLPAFSARRLRRGRRRGQAMKIPRDAYASLYGPTTGDRVRLGDTDLLLEIERDFAVYGEEVTFG